MHVNMIDGSKRDHLLIKPLLRWAGGKQWLCRTLTGLLPQHSDYRYFEPFIGGGSLFFASVPSVATLGDINERLVEAYRVIRDRPADVIEELGHWPNESGTYYAVRSSKFSNDAQRAAQFIYLNRTCWNGLYRVNKLGEFNVPFGNHGRQIFDEEHIFRISEALRNATLLVGDFEDLVEPALEGDFIYLDPPYTVLHSRNGFRRYNERLFSWHDQIRLAQVARKLVNRGCRVIVSNANHPEVVDLYQGFNLVELSRHSVLAANPKKRKAISEALFVFVDNLDVDSQSQQTK